MGFQRAGRKTRGGGKGFPPGYERAFTLSTNVDQSVCLPINTMVATRWNADDGRTTFGVGEPGDPQFTLGAAHEHAVCYRQDRVNCLTPWDCQSKRQYGIDGVYRTLDSGEGAGGQAHGVCYALKGNYIDRETRQNGTGWREGESYTLDATDRHGVVYPQVARSLCARMDSSPCVDRGAETVVQQRQPAAFMGGMGAKARSIAYCDDGTTPTLKSAPSGSNTVPDVVCFAPEQNHCRTFAQADVSATLATGYHYGSGGDAAMVVYDARGNGGGGCCGTLTGDHQNRITDYTTVVVTERKTDE